MKIIAMYFPQFHSIKENDEWWGEGFTDWNNVRASRMQFKGHHQPRVPLHGNYYDQSSLETIRAQVRLARAYGIYGFCHYHYWFDGKQLLETPTELMLSHPDIEMPFCLSWANETWSRRWDGLDHHILIEQTHPPDVASWRRHFEYLLRAWKDPRAIKIDGKPVFVIYRPQKIRAIDQMLSSWRGWAEEAGLPGLYIIFQKQYELPDKNCLAGFDAQFQFQPFESIYSAAKSARSAPHVRLAKGILSRLPRRAQDLASRLKNLSNINKLKFYDYDEVWARASALPASEPGCSLTTYPGAFVDWDNTPRYKERATVFRGANPERFAHWLKVLADTLPLRGLPENYVFLNAWNEWSEGTYLEPDTRHEYRYLEAVKSVVDGNSDSSPADQDLGYVLVASRAQNT